MVKLDQRLKIRAVSTVLEPEAAGSNPGWAGFFVQKIKKKSNKKFSRKFFLVNPPTRASEWKINLNQPECRIVVGSIKCPVQSLVNLAIRQDV